MLKRILQFLGVIVLCVGLGLGFFALSQVMNNSENSPKIIATNFIGYDLARAVTGDTDGLKMLISPGSDMHSFEPTPKDIADITKSDLFIYNGGESEAWVEKLLADNNIPREKTIRLMDLVQLKTEGATLEGSEDSEYDEHIWTSPKNTLKLLATISEKLSATYPENSNKYRENAEKYASELTKLDQAFRDLVANSNPKPLIFADRFPFRYFVDEYGIDYYAAFPGCSEQTEASSDTIAFLIDKVKSEDIKTIFKTELTSDKLARTIAEATGAEIRELNAAHNIPAADFAAGRTYLDILKNNLEVLRLSGARDGT